MQLLEKREPEVARYLPAAQLEQSEEPALALKNGAWHDMGGTLKV